MDQLLQQLAQTLKIPTDALQTVLSNYPKKPATKDAFINNYLNLSVNTHYSYKKGNL